MKDWWKWWRDRVPSPPFGLLTLGARLLGEHPKALPPRGSNGTSKTAGQHTAAWLGVTLGQVVREWFCTPPTVPTQGFPGGGAAKNGWEKIVMKTHGKWGTLTYQSLGPLDIKQPMWIDSSLALSGLCPRGAATPVGESSFPRRPHTDER